MSTWNLHLLGTLSLTPRDFTDGKPAGEPTRLRTRKTVLLLGYLALHPGIHSRELLATTIWPDSAPGKAASSFRVSLSSLRRQLEPVGSVPGSVLLADRLLIGLQHEAIVCDAIIFQELYKKAHSQPEAERIEILRAAFSLYGGRLLQGHYEEWVHRKALYLESLYERVAEELMTWHHQHGEIEAALAVANEAASRVTGRELFAPAILAFKKESRSQSALSVAQNSKPHAFAISPAHTIEVLEVAAHEYSAWLEPVSLPLYPTQFWGRDAESLLLQQTVGNQQSQRLTTVIGPGGMGKTRLAVQVAGQCLKVSSIEKVYFASLAALNSVGSVDDALRSVIGLRPTPGVEPLDQIAEALRLLCVQAGTKSVLLVLDNLEHLLSDNIAFWVQALRLRVPRLLIWATSRAPLKLPGEEFIQLEGLPLPARNHDLSSLTASPSVGMFVQRARGAKPDFTLTANNAEAIARLCHRLEGWPLALELAAARAYSFSPSQMLEQLETGNALLTRRIRRNDPLLARQSSLQSAIEWSYRLLSPEAARLFLSLSVFRNGTTAETVLAMTGEKRTLSCLSELVAHSLVTCHEKAGLLRYDLLDGVRQYARSRFTTSQWQELRQSHARTFAGKLKREAAWTGSRALHWLDQLDAEQENLHAALEWASEFDPALLLQCTCTLWRYWESRGLNDAGRDWLQKALHESVPEDQSALARKSTPAVRSPVQSAAHVIAWNGLSRLCFAGGDFTASFEAASEAITLARRRKIKPGVAHGLLNQGKVWLYRGEIEKAVQLLKQSQEAFDGDASGTAQALIYLGMTEIFAGTYERALQNYQQAIKQARAAEDYETLASALFYCGDILGPVSGLYRAALPYLEESLALSERSGNNQVRCFAHWGLCRAALADSQFEAAQSHLETVRQYCKRSSFLWGQVFVVETAALLAAARSDWKRVALLLGAAEAAHERLVFTLTPAYYAEYNAHFAPLWETLSKPELRMLWQRGRSHTLSQAMEAAEGKTIDLTALLPEAANPSPSPGAPLMAFPLERERAWPILAQVHFDAGRLAWRQKELEAAQRHLQMSRQLFEKTKDTRGKQASQRWLAKTIQARARGT